MRRSLPGTVRTSQARVTSPTSGLCVTRPGWLKCRRSTLRPDPRRAVRCCRPAARRYPSSKAALNMLTSQYAKAFPAIRINAVDPGYTATDLNGHRGTQTVEQGAVIIVRMATITPDGLTGGYFDAVGPVPW